MLNLFQSDQRSISHLTVRAFLQDWDTRRYVTVSMFGDGDIQQIRDYARSNSNQIKRTNVTDEWI